MSQLCQALDNHLEDAFGGKFSLHPNRLKRGAGSNPSFDGLFSTSCSFTLGFGSETGRGYIVNVDVRTLDQVAPAQKEEIREESLRFLSDNISKYIPGRELKIVTEKNIMKIVGDFSLGEL